MSIKAIEVTTTTETKINWWELGMMLANEGDSDEQALFLHGLAVGLNELRGNGGLMQCAYIRDSIDDLGQTYSSEVRQLLNELTPEES